MGTTATAPTEEQPDGTVACPLCDREPETADDVYRHLQVDHRKSALSRAVVAALTDDA